ncbi:MAG: Gfo/Idh/MocA family oxidoreductase [Bacteroidales bacterium]|nr:Gfo/Idh/MocA family oxidoreductase [Bacteroidales bacterium]
MKRILTALFLVLAAVSVRAQEDVIKLGIIGLDTSHSTAFTELLNGDGDSYFVKKFEVVAAYPYGSTTIESSFSRIPGYIEEVSRHGVEICPSIADLLDKVDCILLETNDGRLHLEQAAEVFKSGKPVYIDKPLGSTLAESIAIFKLARQYGVKTFSSSALRYSPVNADIRAGKYGKVLAADCYSPHKVEPTHPDFGFYGIHGVETLYTVMGTGCKTVSRVHSQDGDVCTGVWDDGRIGTFRAIVNGPAIYGGTVYTADGAVQAGGYAGYMVLLEQILGFFETGICPIEPEETIEIFAFMKASNMSLSKGGKPVSVEKAMRIGNRQAKRLLRKCR